MSDFTESAAFERLWALLDRFERAGGVFYLQLSGEESFSPVSTYGDPTPPVCISDWFVAQDSACAVAVNVTQRAAIARRITKEFSYTNYGTLFIVPLRGHGANAFLLLQYPVDAKPDSENISLVEIEAHKCFRLVQENRDHHRSETARRCKSLAREARAIASGCQTRGELEQQVVDFLSASFDTCSSALLLNSDVPDSDSPTWGISASRGLPQYIKVDSYYQKGKGLTGHVLALDPGETLTSDDVESDRRWSRRHLPKSSLGAYQKGPMAFMGARFLAGHINGALVCTRARQSQYDTRTFNTTETETLATIAGVIARKMNSFEVAASKLQARDFKAVAKIAREGTHGTDITPIYDQLLKAIKTKFKFSRLLLAVVSKGRIVGQAVLGFRPSMVSDTNREIHRVPTRPAKKEDILSVLLRQNFEAAVAVDPKNPKDHLQRHIHRATAKKHGLTFPILYVPLRGWKGNLIGILHAEYRDRSRAFSTADIEPITAYTDQLSVLLDLRLALITAEAERQHYGRLLQNTQMSSLDEAIDRALTIVLDGLEILCRPEAAVIYLYNEEKASLEGRASLGKINSHAFRNVIYTIGDAKHDLQQKTVSLAEEVFQMKSPRYFDSMSDCGSLDRTTYVETLNLSLDYSALAIPLAAPARTLGVLIVFAADARSVLKNQQNEIQEYATICALALALTQNTEINHRYRKELELREQIMANIGSIGDDLGRGSKLPLRQVATTELSRLTSVLANARSLFRCERWVLYLADTPCAIPAAVDSAPPLGPWRDTVFRCVSCEGYPESCKMQDDFYRPSSEVGLTSSVLLVRKPKSSSDVEKEPRWSRKHEPKGGTIKLRTWMGVPLLVRVRSIEYLLGVLTFTRLRRHHNDLLYFADEEVKIAGQMAEALAAALYNKAAAKAVAGQGDIADSLIRKLSIVFAAADVVHDIKAPLSNLKGYITARDKDREDKEIALTFEEAFHAVRDFALPCIGACLSTVDACLGYMRNREFVMDSCILQELIKDAHADCLCKEELHMEVANVPSDVAVFGSASMLKIAFKEVFRNASKHNSGCAIDAYLRPRAIGGWLFEVTSRGGGPFPEKLVNDLYAFLVTPKTGMGLLTIIGVINLHGWELNFLNNTENAAILRIEIPDQKIKQ